MTEDNQIIVFDDFLSRNSTLNLKKKLLGLSFPWYYAPSSTYKNDSEWSDDPAFMFHIFRNENLVNSDHYYLILEKFNKLFELVGREASLVRANLVLKKFMTGEVNWHKDREDEHFVALFYVTDSSACTLVKMRENNELRNGKIESKSGRLALIPGEIYHSHQFPVDEDRVVINFIFEGKFPNKLRKIGNDSDRS